MNKLVLHKLMVGLILSFSIYNLNCMQYLPEIDSSIFEREFDPYDLTEIREKVSDAQNVFELNEWFGQYMVCLSLRLCCSKNDEMKKIKYSDVEKVLRKEFTKLVTKKILNDKLTEFDENDPICLLFTIGFKFDESIKLAANEEVITAFDDEKPCPFQTLPNELILYIFMLGSEYCLSCIEPSEQEKTDGFFRKLLGIWGENENPILLEAQKEGKRRDALNAQLSLAVRGALTFIASIMRVNKFFYMILKAGLVEKLKAKISQEFLHEKAVESIMHGKFGLISSLLEENKIDVNCNIGRLIGRPSENFLTLSLAVASKMKELNQDLTPLKNIIRMLILSGSDLQKSAEGSVLCAAIFYKSEDIALLILQNAPHLAKSDKLALPYALGHNMQKLVDLMMENGAIVTSKDIAFGNKLEKYLVRLNSKENTQAIQPKPSRCIVS